MAEALLLEGVAKTGDRRKLTDHSLIAMAFYDYGLSARTASSFWGSVNCGGDDNGSDHAGCNRCENKIAVDLTPFVAVRW